MGEYVNLLGHLERQWTNHANNTVKLMENFKNKPGKVALDRVINAFLDAQPILLNLADEYPRFFKNWKYGAELMINFNDTAFSAIKQCGNNAQSFAENYSDSINDIFGDISKWLKISIQF